MFPTADQSNRGGIKNLHFQALVFTVIIIVDFTNASAFHNADRQSVSFYKSHLKTCRL